MVGLTLAALVMIMGCGDDNGIGGSGGGLFCASDNPEAGETIDCPSGQETIDFCINSRSGDCYYVIGGDEVDCGNCFDNNNFLTDCAQDAIALCD